MLYLLGREIFPTQLYGLMGAGVYLTLLPVVRHGRLAMLGWHHRLLFYRNAVVVDAIAPPSAVVPGWGPLFRPDVPD